MEEKIKNKNIIETIYQAEEKELDEIIKKVNKKIKDQIKDINIRKLLEETSKPNELEKTLERIEENYSIKIVQYNQEFYKQGFIDGVNLMINCLKILSFFGIHSFLQKSILKSIFTPFHLQNYICFSIIQM